LGLKAFEAPGVEPVFSGKDQAIDYAQNRARFRSDEVRIFDSTGNAERVIPFDDANRRLRKCGWFGNAGGDHRAAAAARLQPGCGATQPALAGGCNDCRIVIFGKAKFFRSQPQVNSATSDLC